MYFIAISFYQSTQHDFAGRASHVRARILRSQSLQLSNQANHARVSILLFDTVRICFGRVGSAVHNRTSSMKRQQSNERRRSAHDGTRQLRSPRAAKLVRRRADSFASVNKLGAHSTRSAECGGLQLQDD